MPILGSPISSISAEILVSSFPELQPQPDDRHISLSEIGQGPITPDFVMLLVTLQTTDKKLLASTVKTYVVPKLSCEILLRDGF
jgi:hypothetical protein